MFKLKTAVAAISTVIVVGGISSAQDLIQTEEIGGWRVVTESNPGAEIDPSCILYSPTEDGTFFVIGNPLQVRPSVRGAGYFRIFTNRIISDETQTVLRDTSISIDKTKQWKKNVEWRKLGDDRGSLGVRLEDDIDTLLKAFAWGHTVEMNVTTANGKEHSFAMKLAGFGRALAVFEKCLAKVRVAPE